MGTTDVEVACPRCATPASSRFCGHCGALVRRREPRGPGRPAPAPTAPGGPPPAVAEPTSEAAPPPEGEPVPDRTRPRRRARVLVAVGVLLLAALAAATLVRPAPEVVTADGLAGPDGSGRTSTRAVTGLHHRWDVPWEGVPPGRAGLAGAFEVGRVFVVATDTEVIGLMHPAALAERGGPGDGVNLGGSLDPVLWRLPAVAGTPRLLAGRLPVLAGDELLWLSPEDGAVLDLRSLTGLGRPLRHGPSFGVPAGDAVLAPDGTLAVTVDGEVRWQHDDPGELVAAMRGVAVVLVERTLVGRDLATGEVRWSREVAREGHVGARLVQKTIVTTTVGGRVEILDPPTGAPLRTVQVGPVPANRPHWDGETVVVGAAGGDVFVRVDSQVGIRYARIGVWTGEVEDLRALTDTDVRSISEHDGVLVTTGWDEVAVHAGDGRGWNATELDVPPVVTGGWAVLGVDDHLTVVGVERSRTGIRIEAAPELWQARPAVADGHAVVLGPEGLRSLDLATGGEAWSVPIGTRNCCPSHLVAGDTIAMTGPVRVLGTDGTRRWPEGDPELRGHERAAGVVGPWVVVTRASERGFVPRTLLRAAEDGRDGPTLGLGDVRGPVVEVAGGFAAVAGLPDGTTAVVAFDLPPADAGEDRLPPRFLVPVAPDVQLVSTGEELLVIGAASVQHLDAASGEERRRTQLPTLGSAPAAVAEGRVVRRTGAHTLEAVELSSGERWTRRFESALASAPTVAGDVVYVGDTAGVVFALSLDDGETLASVTVPGRRAAALTVAGGVLLAGGTDRLHAFGPPSTAAVSTPAGRRDR